MKKCNICQSENIYINCKECGIIYNENIPDDNKLNSFYKKEYRDNIAGEVLDNGYYDSRKFVNISRWKYMRNIIGNDIHLKRSLDIGCSEGSFLEVMRENGFASYGVEPNEKYSHFKHNENIDNIDFDRFNTSINFGLITIFHTLEHLNDPIKTLNKINNLLIDGGYIVIEVPNTECKYCKSSDIMPEHIYYFNKKNITKMLELCNFKIIDIRTVSDDINIVSPYIVKKFRHNKFLKRIYHIFLPFLNRIRFGKYDNNFLGSDLRVIGKKLK